MDFDRDVKPILAQRCYKCHSSLQEESSFRVDSVAGILKGGDYGPAVGPGKSSASRLIEAVLQKGDLKMPPEGSPLTEAQIATIRAWIDAGETDNAIVQTLTRTPGSPLPRPLPLGRPDCFGARLVWP